MGEITYSVAEGIARLELSNPPYNCLTQDMFRQLGEHVDRLVADPAVRVAVLSGAGDRLYTVGADIREMAALAGEDASVREQSTRTWLANVDAVLGRLEASPKPFICAMKGISFGGGIEIAAACDIRVAAAGAQFCMPELRLGIIPGYGGTQRLQRLIGPGPTRYWLLTATVIGAAEALRLGLVDAVAPDGYELQRAEQAALSILQQAPLAVMALKHVLRRGAELPLADAIALEARMVAALTASDDVREGVLAFMGKRQPVWNGRCPASLQGVTRHITGLPAR